MYGEFSMNYRGWSTFRVSNFIKVELKIFNTNYSALLQDIRLIFGINTQKGSINVQGYAKFNLDQPIFLQVGGFFLPHPGFLLPHFGLFFPGPICSCS